MFNKLRLKLTLINATVIFLLFFLLITGTYYSSRLEFSRRSEMLANKIMQDIQSGLIDDLPFRPPERPGPVFFFIKTHPGGQITAQSSNPPLAEDEIPLLNAAALADSNTEGIITLNGTEYKYLKSDSGENDETTILFQDLTPENNMLLIQLTALMITGLVCLLLSFLGSFFMANRAMGPIQKAWKQQQDFLSDVSHELRTPLAIIQTNLDVVLGSPAETVASQDKWLQNIREESAQMAQLVDSLLFLARADSHQQPLSKRLFSLDAALRQAVTPFEALASLKKLTLNISSPQTVMALGDEARMKQVIGILLDNAIRHTPADGTITIRLAQTDHKIVLTVTDSGEGIEPDSLQKIFNRFYQVDKSRANGGAGLGLSIAKWIVQSHHGTISATSEPGVKTMFSIQLPKAPASQN